MAKQGEACAHVKAMLEEVMSIAFDRERRTLHLRFYDRNTAGKYAGLPLPFRDSLLRLHGVAANAPDGDENTPSPTRYQMEYTMRLYNVTAHISIKHLYEYLKQRSEFAISEFKSEDLGGGSSQLSQTWFVRFVAAKCPQFLARKTHLSWMGLCAPPLLRLRDAVRDLPPTRPSLVCVRYAEISAPPSRSDCGRDRVGADWPLTYPDCPVQGRSGENAFCTSEVFAGEGDKQTGEQQLKTAMEEPKAAEVSRTPSASEHTGSMAAHQQNRHES